MSQHGLMVARPRVVVVGGGFGGLAAVRRLARAPVDVTLIDRTNHHLFQPLLYQVATGLLSPGEIAPPLRVITHRQANAAVHMAEVTGIDPDRRRVHLRGADGTSGDLGYDHLIVAAGARDSYFGHRDWARHLHPMKTLAQAVDLRDKLLAAYERAADTDDRSERDRWTTFVIIGGGPTGVEVAGQLVSMARQFQRDFHRLATGRARIVIVEAGDSLLAAFSAPLRAHAQRKLSSLGVEIRVGTKAVRVDGRGVDVEGGGGARERVAAGTVVWAAGVKASPLAAMLGDATGASVDHRGRVQVAPDCSLPGHPEVFAIGDMADADNLPGLAEPAMQEGWYVAKHIHRQITGRSAPGRFRYRDLGTMATISPVDAVADAFGLRLSGVPAKVAWAAVHLAFLTGWGKRGGVLARWAYELGTSNRSERVILEGVGSEDGLNRLAHSDEPAAETLMAGR
jgi:NADH:ubiquinone reductase (H+-translocating)